MRIGTKTDLKADSFAVFESSRCVTRAVKLTQNCIRFDSSRTNLFFPFSVTREYHHMLLELIDLLQCIAAYLQYTLPWVSGGDITPRSCSCYLSFPFDRTQLKTDQVHVEGPVHRVEACQFVCKKQTNEPATSSSDTLVDSAVTVHRIHIDYEGEW